MWAFRKQLSLIARREAIQEILFVTLVASSLLKWRDSQLCESYATAPYEVIDFEGWMSRSQHEEWAPDTKFRSDDASELGFDTLFCCRAFAVLFCQRGTFLARDEFRFSKYNWGVWLEFGLSNPMFNSEIVSDEWFTTRFDISSDRAHHYYNPSPFIWRVGIYFRICVCRNIN